MSPATQWVGAARPLALGRCGPGPDTVRGPSPSGSVPEMCTDEAALRLRGDLCAGAACGVACGVLVVLVVDAADLLGGAGVSVAADVGRRDGDCRGGLSDRGALAGVLVA